MFMIPWFTMAMSVHLKKKVENTVSDEYCQQMFLISRQTSAVFLDVLYVPQSNAFWQRIRTNEKKMAWT